MSRQERVEIVFSTKGTDSFTRDLKNMQTNMKAVDSQIRLASQNLKTYGNNVVNLRQKQQLLKQQMENVRKEITKYNDAIEKNENKLKENQKTLTELANKKKQLTQEVKNAERAFGKESEEAKKLREELEKTKTQYTEINNKIKDNERNLDNYSTKVNNAKTKLAQLDGELKNVNDKLWEQTNKLYQASQSLEKLGKTLQTIGGGMTSIGNKILAMTAPLITFMGLASKLGIDFEYQMDKVQAISGSSASQMEQLTEKAKLMGETTSKSAKNAGEAFEYMSLAGWSVDDMLNSVEPMLKASVAYGADLGELSDLITDTMGSLGLQTEDLAYYLDIVSNAQNKSNTSAMALLQAYIECGAVLSKLNVPLEESSTLLGVLANNGYKGSQAGNSLSSILVNLTKAGGESSKALQEIGVSAFDSEGNFIGLHETLVKINEAFSGMSEEQRTVYTSMIAGKEQLAPFQILLDSLTGSYDSLFYAQQNANGALSNMYNIMSDNTKTKIDEFLSKLEALGLQLADVLLPHINDLVDVGIRFVDTIRSWDDSTLGFMVNLTAISTSLGLLFKVVGSGVTSFGSLITGGGKVLDFFSKIGKGTHNIINKYTELNSIIKADKNVIEAWTQKQARVSESIDVHSRNILKLNNQLREHTYAVKKKGEVTARDEKITANYLRQIEKQKTALKSSQKHYDELGRKIESQKNLLDGNEKALSKLTGSWKKYAIGGVAVAGTIAVVAGAIYATKEYMDAMNNTCTKSKEEMSALEIAFTVLGGGVVRSRKELEKMGLVEEKLSNRMSKDFRQAVIDTEKEVEDFNFTLHKITLDGVVTPEEITGVVDRVNKMCDQTLQAIESRQSELSEAFNKVFNDDGNIDEDEKTLLWFLDRQFEESKTEVERYQKEINELRRKVEQEGYELTEEDIALIKDREAKIAQIKIQALAENETEVNFAKNKWRSRAENLDAESASKMIKQRKKELQEQKELEEGSYLTTLEYLKNHLDEMEGEEKASAQRQIYDIEQKLKTIDGKYQDYYNQDLEYLYEHNEYLRNEINVTNGELLEETDKKCNRELETLKSHYRGIENVAKSGLTTLYNTTSQAYEDVYVEVDQATGKIIGVTSTWTDEEGIHAKEIEGYTEDIKDNVSKMSESAISNYNALNSALLYSRDTTVRANGDIVNSNGDVVGSLKDIKTGADGTKEGIVELNGTPVKVKFDNKDGTIQNAKDIENSIRNIPEERTVKVKMIYEGDGTYSDGRGNVWVNGKLVSGSGYATGGTVQESGIYGVNEEGWELVQGTARALSDTMMYASAGTKVTNHLNSIEQMRRDIKAETARQLGNNNFGDIIVNSGDIIVQGNLDNVTLNDLDKVLARNNKQLKDTIYSEMNKVTKKY